jgi:hypothetical protein
LERLINERSKIILEIEELRARSYAYIPGQGGKGEIERNRKLKESEERLQRYCQTREFPSYIVDKALFIQI